MGEYFYGWYFRCQGEDGTFAVIPAVHGFGGKWSCSVQVIMENSSREKAYPIRQFRINRKKGIMQIGENLFSRKGLRLNMEDERQGYIKGVLRFGEFAPPSYDIMGPFRYVPCMECRHAVYSMEHSVDGEVNVAGEKLRFRGGRGYMEGDSGKSFPEKYVWTQHFFDKGSLMLAAASIPLSGMRFAGTIGVLRRGGNEYRFATYLGASVRQMEKGELCIRQGKSVLKVQMPKSGGRALNAPCRGKMSRRIREEIACPVEYELTYGERTVWHEKAARAALECEV